MDGSNTVSATGTAGALTGNNNHGVTIQNDFNRVNKGIITSSGGNVTVTGTGGGSGTLNFRIQSSRTSA